MKAIIYNSERIDLENLQDMEKLIPKGYSGKALNYGQGEGQVEISGRVWGIYVDDNNDRTLQFEEGSVGMIEFIQTLKAIETQLKEKFGGHIKIEVQGMLNHFSQNEKYT